MSVELITREIIDRCKYAVGVRLDSEMAEHFNTPERNIGTWIHRNTVPLNVLVDFSTAHDISLDWLLLGKKAAEKFETDDEFARRIIESLDDPAVRSAVCLTVSEGLA